MLSNVLSFFSSEFKQVQRDASRAGYKLERHGRRWVLAPAAGGAADLFNGTIVHAAFDSLQQVAYYVRYSPAYA